MLLGNYYICLGKPQSTCPVEETNTRKHTSFLFNMLTYDASSHNKMSKDGSYLKVNSIFINIVPISI